MPQRSRDYIILVSNSASQAGPSWIASGQIAEAIIKNAAPEDRVSLWTVSTPDMDEVKGDLFEMQDARALLEILDEYEYVATGNRPLFVRRLTDVRTSKDEIKKAWAYWYVGEVEESKRIVSINKDPEAPILQISDLGIVGDTMKVLPALIEELKKRTG